MITLRGWRVLQQAEVVVADSLVDGRLLRLLPPGVKVIQKREPKEKWKYMLQEAKKGKRVVRLKNGDPFLFSRIEEELELLVKEGIEFAVVPGISAAFAAASFSGVPLTSRRLSSWVTLVTGKEAEDKEKSIPWEELGRGGTLVIYMGIESLRDIVERIIQGGRDEDTPVMVISFAGSMFQQMVRGSLKDIPEKVKEKKISAPAVVIIGEVVLKEGEFNWFRKAKKLLFTGLSPERFFYPGLVFHLPLIEIKPLEDYREMDALIERLEEFDWIVFSSRYGVIYFLQRLFSAGKDMRALHGIRVAAIGKSTAGRLEEYGVKPDLVPMEESSKGLLEEFRKRGITGVRILLPRSDIADKGLTRGFEELGNQVYPCIAYRNTIPQNLPDIDFRFFDEIMFTSPSTVRNFFIRYRNLPSHIRVRWIGDVTRRELERFVRI